MSAKLWFIPCASGDYRLLPHPTDANASRLTMERPTAAEQVILGRYLRGLVAGGVLQRIPEIDATREVVVDLPIPLSDAGSRLLVTLAAGMEQDGERWTAIRSVAGAVSLVPATTGSAAESVAAAVAQPEVAAAVSYRAPLLGCPPPIPVNRRASEALRTFSTTRQWADWCRGGSMRAVGHATGATYQVYHRSMAAARGLGHVVVHEPSGAEVCAWDARVPAEEEVLALKLTIEHRESYIQRIAPWVALG